MRDVLVAAAVVVIAGHRLHLPSTPVALLGAILCFALRMIAIRRRWTLPISNPSITQSEPRL